MTTTIAISGKGGSGKTTLAAMIVRILCEECEGSVLAVDADPNSCLGLTMGLEPVGTIAEVREKAAEKTVSNTAVDRVRLFEYGIQQSVTEGTRFDLLTMGQPEGPSCYCAANNLLRKFLDELSTSYRFVVMDNEAGMEHLSRRTTNSVDMLCIIADATNVGTITARRIFELSKRLPISVKEAGVIWNRIDSGNGLGEIETFGSVPYDDTVFDASMQGKTIFDLKQNSPAFVALREILKRKLKI